MADDLADDWWQDDEEEKEASENEPEQTTQKTDATDEQKKKRKRKKKKNITEELKEKGDPAGTPQDVVEFLKKQFKDKLSPVEWDEVSLNTDKHFYKANISPEFPVAYLRAILAKWKKLKETPLSEGSPLLLVISASAGRAVQLNRQIQEFKGENCKCAKLFAKHMKITEQEKFLKKSVCHMGVGTPNRILTLIKSGHLKLDKLCAIVFDWNWRDVKQRRLVDIPEVRAELASLLQSQIIPYIKSEVSCKIGIL